VETIFLPHKLPGVLELVALNQSLHRGDIRLNWSTVAGDTSMEQLAVLLAGLDADEHAEVIGAETIPHELESSIIELFEHPLALTPATLETGTEIDDDTAEGAATPLAEETSPDLWLPEEENHVEVEEEDASCQHKSSPPHYCRPRRRPNWKRWWCAICWARRAARKKRLSTNTCMSAT
jgi:hypothetical protein